MTNHNFKTTLIRQIAIYFVAILFTTSCNNSDKKITNALPTDTTNKPGVSIIDTGHAEITGLIKVQLNDTIKGNLKVVGDGIEYMSKYTKFSAGTVSNPEVAWKEIKSLYPEFAGHINYWTEYNGYYVFSVGFNTTEMDRFFWHILYVEKGGREFRYFWPHT